MADSVDLLSDDLGSLPLAFASAGRYDPVCAGPPNYLVLWKAGIVQMDWDHSYRLVWALLLDMSEPRY